MMNKLDNQKIFEPPPGTEDSCIDLIINYLLLQGHDLTDAIQIILECCKFNPHLFSRYDEEKRGFDYE